MSQLVTFNSSSYNIPTTSEVGWSTTVTNFLADVGANAVDKASTQTIAGNKTFTGAINLTSATLTGFHTLGLTDSASSTALTLDGSNNVVVTNNLTVNGTSTLTGNTQASGTLGVTGNTTLSGTLAVTGAVALSVPLATTGGGTGSATTSGARTNLGLAIGTNVQAWGANLDTFSALSTAAANAGQSAVVAQTGGWALAGPVSSFKNKLINGDHRLDQRNLGAIVTPATTVYATDRWQLQQSVGSKLTFQQASTITPTFLTSLKLSVASSFTPGATDVYSVRQAIEGVNMSDLGWGAAGAKPITISFWVQSSITGTFNIAIQNGTSNRCYGATYTIAVANTTQFVTLTIPGDTTGTWAIDNTAGLWLQFDLGSGSSFTFASGSWTASSLYSATGATKFVSQVNGSTLYITGVQLEAGSVATAFERRAYHQELMLAQRYYETGIWYLLAAAGSATPIGATVGFKVTKRVAPTMAGTPSALSNVTGGTVDLAGVDAFRAWFTATGVSSNSGNITWSAASEL